MLGRNWGRKAGAGMGCCESSMATSISSVED